MAVHPRRHGLLLIRRVVFVTQQVDPGHPALAATIPKIEALARLADEVVVLALGDVAAPLPANVRTRSFGGRSKASRGLRYLAALARELRPRPEVVVAHMCPIYAVLAAPVARPLGVPVVLWYTHWRATPTLRAAEKLVTAAASVDRRSFPIASPKVRAIGHGIDVDEFPCVSPAPGGGLRALALGRYSPAKGLEVVLEGVRIALDRGVDMTLQVHGPELTELERSHRRSLDARVAELGLDGRVRLEGPVPRTEIPRLFAGADVLINNMRAGAPDKIVYEAAASCLPVVASNPVFDGLLGGLPLRLDFDRGRPEELAERLEAVAAAAADTRGGLGRDLRERVVREHSVTSWAERLLQAAGG